MMALSGVRELVADDGEELVLEPVRHPGLLRRLARLGVGRLCGGSRFPLGDEETLSFSEVVLEPGAMSVVTAEVTMEMIAKYPAARRTHVLSFVQSNAADGSGWLSIPAVLATPISTTTHVVAIAADHTIFFPRKTATSTIEHPSPSSAPGLAPILATSARHPASARGRAQPPVGGPGADARQHGDGHEREAHGEDQAPVDEGEGTAAQGNQDERGRCERDEHPRETLERDGAPVRQRTGIEGPRECASTAHSSGRPRNPPRLETRITARAEAGANRTLTSMS